MSKPSKFREDYWIFASRKVGAYPKGTDNSGKWLIFAKKGDKLDDIWEKILDMTEKGLLGEVSKVSTMKKNKNAVNQDYGVICVYTYNSKDKEDLKRIAKEIFTIPSIKRINYKEDILTILGAYSKNKNSKLSKYSVTKDNFEEILK